MACHLLEGDLATLRTWGALEHCFPTKSSPVESYEFQTLHYSGIFKLDVGTLSIKELAVSAGY
jgi:hypothetical protein